MPMGRTINVGSRATGSAAAKAANVAIGSNGAVVGETRPTRSQRPLGSVKRSIHPGSAAGLKSEKTVHLQYNGSGYLNKANQTARYKPKMPTRTLPVRMQSPGLMPSPKLFDRRLGSASSSISLLKKRI